MYLYTHVQCSFNTPTFTEIAQSEIFSLIMVKFKEDIIHLLYKKKRNMGKKGGDHIYRIILLFFLYRVTLPSNQIYY